MIAPKFNSLKFDLLMKINRIDFGHAIFEIGFGIEHFIGANVTLKNKIL